MRCHYRQNAWMLLIILLIPARARSQTSLEVFFPNPVIAGQTAQLGMRTIGDWSYHTDCQNFRVYSFGVIEWGDGAVTTWQFDSEGYHGGPTSHIYAVPGGYCLKVTLDWSIALAWGGGPPCQGAQGTHIAETLVDVSPSGGFPPDGSLGVFFDQQGTICSQPPAFPNRLYVVAVLAGASSSGIAGAEFRLQTSGGFWFSANAPAGWITVGNPLGDGTTMARSCPPASGADRVVVLEITAYPLGAGCGGVLVAAHRNPPNPNYPSPIFVLCDAPTFTVIRAERWYAASIGPAGGQCSTPPVAVQEKTWSGLKGLYR